MPDGTVEEHDFEDEFESMNSAWDCVMDIAFQCDGVVLCNKITPLYYDKEEEAVAEDPLALYVQSEKPPVVEEVPEPTLDSSVFTKVELSGPPKATKFVATR